MLTGLFAFFAWIVTMVSIEVVVLIYGWGLQPQYWAWIIGVGIFGRMLWMMLGNRIVKDFSERVRGEKP